jgi:hypothetical protein
MQKNGSAPLAFLAFCGTSQWMRSSTLIPIQGKRMRFAAQCLHLLPCPGTKFEINGSVVQHSTTPLLGTHHPS